MRAFFRRHYLSFGIGIVVMAIVALSYDLAIRDMGNQRQRAEDSSRNLLTLLARDLGTDFAALDTILTGVAKGLNDPLVWEMVPELRHRVIFSHISSLEVSAILILNRHGDIVMDGRSVVPRPGNFSDRDYFRVHMGETDIGLYVSRPILNRLNGTMGVVLSRRIDQPDGDFGGVAAVHVPLSSLYDRVKVLDLGKGGDVTIFRDDGSLMARKPMVAEELGRDFSRTPNVRRSMMREAGSFDGTSVIDGVRRHYTFTRVEGLPLILSVSYAVDEVMAPWRENVAIQTIVTVLLCTCLFLLLVMFRRELRLRHAAQTRVENLARTDELTQLPNRRAFRERSSVAWAEAIRQGKSVSALFMDADLFKKYNDTYGHGMGDVLLRSIGTTLAASIREGDIAARYGGEEFVCLLPGTAPDEALRIAERIRDAILRLNVPHEQNPYGIATLSIGVASMVPSEGDDCDALFRTADEALYQAKKTGRNRVCVA